MADTSRATPADYNLRILAPLARYFEESVQGGRDVFAAVCERAGVERAAFDKRIHWVSWETAEAVLKEARPLFGSDEELGRACAYRMNESYGLMVLLGFGVSPRLVYAGAARAGKALTSVGKFTVVQTTARSARLRYESQKHESRLLCLSRQMQCAALPGLFGLPEAHVRELSCIARGDDCCEYEFTWINRRKWALPLLGVLLGAGLAYFLPSMGPMTYSVPLIAGLIGHIVERHRVATDNEQTMTEIVSALRQTMADEAEVRRELVALQERHEQWGRILERSRNDTQAAIDAAASKLSTFDPDQETALRGLGHDLRSPLTVISASLEVLKDTASLNEEQMEVARDMQEAISKMSVMLREMMALLHPQSAPVLQPVVVQTKPLVDSIKRRANALVFGKDVRVTVFANRECPETMEIDPIAFDRIVDNLLSNAAKYTPRGSIVIELDGIPGFFVLKIGDTGRGMKDEELERVFTPGSSDVSRRAPGSYGIGLSAVVELLSRMGGRLEVMSQVDAGTTFWIYLPIKLPPDAKLISFREKKHAKRLIEVVQVRKHPA